MSCLAIPGQTCPVAPICPMVDGTFGLCPPRRSGQSWQKRPAFRPKAIEKTRVVGLNPLDVGHGSRPSTVMQDRSSKRPRDANQLAKLITDIATGAIPDDLVDPTTGKNAAAVALGRRGELRGGVMRAQSLTSEQRSAIAAKAARARWAKADE